MSKIATTGGIGADYLIASIFGEEGNALINVQIAPAQIATIAGRINYSGSHITSLANIFVPFSTDSITAPAFSNRPNLDSYNLNRQGATDYEEIDGKDFRVVPNKFTYYKVRALDYDIVSTIGNRLIDNYDLTIKNYDDDAEIRTVGLKTPVFQAGWGLDMAGRPVPSIYDIQKKANLEDLGELEDSTNKNDIEELEKRKNTYAYGYNTNAQYWVAGPVDTRWDQYRGVWAAAPVIVEGYLLQDLTEPSGRATKLKYTSGEILIYTGQHNSWGKIQPEQKAWVINRSVGLTADSGTYIAAMWFPNGEFRPIWVDCEIDPSGSGAEVPSLELADE